METCDDGQSRHYCLARTCRPHSELTGQLIWKQLYTNKWAEFCKDPVVTPPEAADPNLLFFHPVAIFFGIDFSHDHCKSLQEVVS